MNIEYLLNSVDLFLSQFQYPEKMGTADEGGPVQPIANRCWQNNLFVQCCERGCGHSRQAKNIRTRFGRVELMSVE